MTEDQSGYDRPDEQLDALLAAALREEHFGELDALPGEEELSKALSFSPAFRRRLRMLRHLAQKGEREGRRPSLAFQRAAVVLLAMLGLSCAVFLSAPEAHASMKNIFMNWFDTHAEFQFSPAEPVGGCVTLAPGYLPAGFALVEKQEMDMMGFYEYKGIEGERLSIQYADADSTTMGIDNEHSTHTVIEVHGAEAHLFEGYPGYPSFLLWEEQGVAFTIISDSHDTDELLKIADNLQAVSQ